jgi:23S rRNA pseudouridine1911/1915/1917 synthase
MRTTEQFEGEAGVRLDRFLADHLPRLSRSHLQRLIEDEDVQVGGRLRKSSYGLKGGEVVTVVLPEDTPRLAISSEAISILYEDEDVLVVDKPAGLVTHPNDFNASKSVIQSLLNGRASLGDAIYDPNNETSWLRPGVVHRLDKDTSGVLVIAKNQVALRDLAEQFRNHTVEKEYVALLAGKIPDQITVDQPIRRKPGKRNMMGISLDLEEGRAARSAFSCLRGYTMPEGTISYVSCRLETGRTHQIRVHAKYLGAPVLGDTRYANVPATKLAKRLHTTRQMLHAHSLSFHHPTDKRPMCFKAPLHADMQRIVDTLEDL